MATKTFKIGLSNTDKQNMASDILSRVLDLTFDEYSSSSTYDVGDYVVYNNALYRCIVAVTSAEAFDPLKWEAATLGDLVDDVNGAVASVSGKANIIDLENGTLVPAKSLTAQQLENASEESGDLQDKPFRFQATGTDSYTKSVDTAPIAKQIKLKGHSVVWSQRIKAMNSTNWFTTGGTKSFNDDVGTFTAAASRNRFYSSTQYVSGHKYLAKVDIKLTSASQANVENGNNRVCVYFQAGAGITVLEYASATTEWQTITKVFTAQVSNDHYTYPSVQDNNTSDWQAIQVKNVQIFDLNELELDDLDDYSYEGANNQTITISKIAVFNSLYPLPYYSYNAGEIKESIYQSLETIGYNQFDGELEGNRWSNTDESSETSAGSFRSKNFIPVIPGQTYTIGSDLLDGTNAQLIVYQYDGNKKLITSSTRIVSGKYDYTLRDNTQYIRFAIYKSGSGWATNVPSNETAKCFANLIWDKSRTGYEEYWKKTYTLPTLLTPLRSADDACDEYLADGTHITKIEKVNIIDLINGQYQLKDADNGSGKYLSFSGGYGYLQGDKLAKPSVNTTTEGNIRCNLGARLTENEFYKQHHDTDYRSINVCYMLSNGGSIGFMSHDLDNLSTKQDLVDYFTSHPCYIYYELLTPVVSQEAPIAENVEIDDFGTMHQVSSATESSSSPLIPQSIEFFYPADYVLFIDSLYNAVEGDASKVATKDDLHELPSDAADGTYIRKAVKSGDTITYTWVLEEE